MELERKGLSVKIAAVFVIVLILVGAGGYYAGSSLTYPAAYEAGYSEGHAAGVGEIVEKKGTLKIGLAVPVTGAAAADGEACVDGAKLAVDEIMAEGGLCGYDVEIVIGDTREMEAGTVVSVFERLITKDKVDVILGGYGSLTQCELDIAKKYWTIYIINGGAMATSRAIGDRGDEYPMIFNTGPSAELQGIHPIEWIDYVEEEGIWEWPTHTYAFIASDNTWTMGITKQHTDELLEREWTITLEEVLPFGPTTEYGPTLAKLKANPPDIIEFTDYIPTNQICFLEQFLLDPTDSIIIMQYGPLDPEFRKLGGEMINDVLLPEYGCSSYMSKWTYAIELTNKVTELLGREPQKKVLETYENLWWWANACKEVDNPKDKYAVAKAMEVNGYKSFVGFVRIDPKTRILAYDPIGFPLTIYQLKNQELVCIYPKEWADADFEVPRWFQK